MSLSCKNRVFVLTPGNLNKFLVKPFFFFLQSNLDQPTIISLMKYNCEDINLPQDLLKECKQVTRVALEKCDNKMWV